MLFDTQQKIEHLTKLEKALSYRLSFADNGTVAHGDDFDLLIETCGRAATIRQLKHTKES